MPRGEEHPVGHTKGIGQTDALNLSFEGSDRAENEDGERDQRHRSAILSVRDVSGEERHSNVRERLGEADEA